MREPELTLQHPFLLYLAILLPEDVGGGEGAWADPTGEFQLRQQVNIDVRTTQDLRGRLWEIAMTSSMIQWLGPSGKKLQLNWRNFDQKRQNVHSNLVSLDRIYYYLNVLKIWQDFPNEQSEIYQQNTGFWLGKNLIVQLTLKNLPTHLELKLVIAVMRCRNQRIYISDRRVIPPLRCLEEALTQPLSALSAVHIL